MLGGEDVSTSAGCIGLGCGRLSKVGYIANYLPKYLYFSR